MRLFDTTALKYSTMYSDIIPNAPELFILPELTSVLQLQADQDTNLCKQFTISEFVKMLPRFLPKNKFSGVAFISAIKISECLHAENSCEWIRRVWEFISSFVPVQDSELSSDHSRYSGTFE